MRSPLVLGSIIGAVALIGAAAVGMTYFALQAVSPSPQPSEPRPVAVTTRPALSAPPAAMQSPLPRPARPRPVHIRTYRRACPVPAVYHPRRPSHHFRPTRIHVVQPVYPPPPPLVEGYPGPYWRAGWRRPGWRAPGWRYPPRWAYGPRPGYGPGWRDW